MKRIEVFSSALNANQLAEMAYQDRIFSAAAQEEQQARTQRFRHMTLQPLYKRPPPLWAHPVFQGEFGDAYLENTGMEGGDVLGALAAFDLVLSSLLSGSENRNLLVDYTPADNQVTTERRRNNKVLAKQQMEEKKRR